MRLKTLSLAAIAAVAAMVFVGTSSATAGETALCKVNQSPCEEGNLVTSVHMELASGATWSFSTNLFDIQCSDVLAEASVGEAGAPQAINITSFAYPAVCETEESDPCWVTTTASKGNPDTATLLTTAENLGSLVVTDEGAKITLECEDIFFSTDIACTFRFTGLSFHVVGGTESNKGMLNPEALPLESVSGLFCPETAEITGGLLEPLEATYISQGKGKPLIEITLPNPEPHLFVVDQVKTITITNKRDDQVKLEGETIDGPFNAEGSTCNTLKLNKNDSCTHRKLKCIGAGPGAFTARAVDSKTSTIEWQTLHFDCHTKKDLGG